MFDTWKQHARMCTSMHAQTPATDEWAISHGAGMLLCMPCTEALSVMATEISSTGQLLSTITTVLVYLEKCWCSHPQFANFCMHLWFAISDSVQKLTRLA